MPTLSGTSPLRVRAALFDLGDTLWHRTDAASWAILEVEANLRAVATLRALLPVAALPAVTDDALGASLRMLIEGSLRHHRRVTPDDEPRFAQVTAGALRTLGISRADAMLGAQVYEALRVRAVSSRVLYPDTLSTLAALTARGYLLGIVTNRHYGGTPFMADLRQMGLLDFVAPEHIAISADLGHRKPHLALYRHVLERLNVAPTEAAMVGDNLIADVYGAQQLGLFTVWKPKQEYWAAVKDPLGMRREHTYNSAHEAQAGAGPAPEHAPRHEHEVATSRHELLFARARQRAQALDPRAGLIEPPNAIIMEIGEVLDIFWHDRHWPVNERSHT